MKRLEDGRYQLEDGRVLTPEELTSLHLTAPRPVSVLEAEKAEGQELQEGECSGPQVLND